MNATISTVSPKPGNVAFLTQSGGLGIIIFSQTHRYNVGLSMFASIGNKADVLDNDMIEYWGNDERTDVILLYMEGVDNPRQFAQAVRRVSKKKPILAVKAGRTTVGARAASSHTGAMAEEDSIITGLFEQCGIIRVDSIEELFELAVSFSRKRFPKSKKVAVISNGGGPAVMAVDACIGLGLDVSPFSETTRKKIADSLFDISATVNPVDMSGMAGTAEFEKVLQCAIEDSEIGSALVILVKSPVLIDPMDVLNKIENASQTTDKPILTMVIGQDVMRRNNESDSIPDIPVYECIESAVWTLFNMTRYKEWLEKQDGHIKTYDVDKNSVNALLAPESNKSQHYLEPGHVFEILSAYRFPVIPSFDAGTLHQAITIAEQIGYPIVLKGIAKGLIHKSDIGGVALDLRTREEVIKAFAEIKERVNAVNYDSFEGVIVQKMITSGREVILGMTAIEHLGPVLMFGLGGIFVEAIRDVCFRPAPITDVEADEIIRSIKGYPILKGIRGEKGVDIECIKECLLRLSQLVCDFDCIQSIDINPFKVGESARTSFVVDARIVVGKK
jgi:acetyltransferase